MIVDVGSAVTGAEQGARKRALLWDVGNAGRQGVKGFKQEIPKRKSNPIKESARRRHHWIIRTIVFTLPTNNVMRFNAVTGLHHAVVLPCQHIGIGMIGSVWLKRGLAFLPLALKSTIDSIEGVPILAMLTAMTNQIGNAVLPTSDTRVTVSPFGCNVLFPDVMVYVIILLTVAAPIAACCILLGYR